VTERFKGKSPLIALVGQLLNEGVQAVIQRYKRLVMSKKQSNEEADTMDVGGDNAEPNQDVNQDAAAGPHVEVQESLEAQLADAKDRYLRLAADFENFKRRALKEQSELLKYQGEKLVVDMLEVLDNLELALAHTSAGQESLKTGLEMVLKLFVEKLNKWQIRGESSMGAKFDPLKHAAISRVPGAESGVIVGELKKPYHYKDKLIRFGEVIVATASDEA
jgi:molecular chaperone GrpE